jgi:superfamily II DNA or RNA helicase
MGRFNGDKILTILIASQPEQQNVTDLERIEPIIEVVDEEIQQVPDAPLEKPFLEPAKIETEEEPIINVPKVNEQDSTSIQTAPFQLPDTMIKLNDSELKIQQAVGAPDNQDIESKEYNTFLFQKEKLEHEAVKTNPTADFDFLYPELNDPEFNVKIAKRKEFHDTKFDGEIYDIKTQAEKMCNADFELLPHQLFVKNFLSYQTPYNCLLLYHLLGSGKTCSAIGVAEEMRNYMKQTGIFQKNKRILIVASPNVQNNFRLQLFDERKLKKENELWNLNTCIGNSLLSEINPTTMHQLNRQQVVREITNVIKTYYEFVGYDKLANIIRAETKQKTDERETPKVAKDSEQTKEQKELEIKKIRQFFNHRLIIIDEVHNITLAQDNKEAKKVGSLLMRIARYAQNIRMLLLSATPVYNNYKEIIWLTNLMNAVDKRSSIKTEDVFDKEGKFIEERTTKDGLKLEGGRELLKRKLTGYVSYVRGENPYTFPFRLYPDTFAADRTLDFKNLVYPKVQMNLKPIEEPLQHLVVYMNDIGEYQEKAYKFIMENLRNKSFNTFDVHGQEREMPTFENMDSFGYTHLQHPLECLNIIFPNPDFNENEVVHTSVSASPAESTSVSPEESTSAPPAESTSASPEESTSASPAESTSASPAESTKVEGTTAKKIGGSISDSDESPESKIEDNGEIIRNMTGKQGLSNIMTYDTIRDTYELRKNFEYKPAILEKYGRIFHPDTIGKYSGKIANLCNIVRNSEGIIIIYSQYIDGGVVPLALALEEMGFARYGWAAHTTSLLKTPPPPEKQLDGLTMKTKEEFLAAKQAGEKVNGKQLGEFSQARYVMITGDKTFSPNNLADIKYVTNKDNVNGEKVKVILISQAAAEGLDFKNVRQVHILSPWYNMNRIEQIIGRGVRNLSHCDLPFEKRNVEIYLHSTKPKADEEPADLYLYRYAEKKAIQIGEITRLMKEVAVDCILNISQTNLTVEKLLENAANKKIKIQLSSNPDEIEFKVGDKPFTDICDYKDNCNFVCSPTIELQDSDITKNTYNIDYAKTNYAAIVKRIRQLFREQFFYSRENLISAINILRVYPDEQIDYALSRFVDNENEAIVDKYGRSGYLMNTENMYVFQPIEITDERSSLFDRSVPIDFKNNYLTIDVDPEKREKEKNIQKEKENLAATLTRVESEEIREATAYDKIVNKIEECFATIEIEKKNAILKNPILEDENDWYIHFGRVYEILRNESIHNISEEYLKKYVYHHFLDTLSFEDRKTIVEHIYREQATEQEYEKIIRGYFDEKLVERNGIRGIVLAVENKTLLFIQNQETKLWDKSKPSENMLFQPIVQKKYEVLRDNISNMVGFMYKFKKEGIVFKTKDMLEKRNNTGSRCSGSTKNDIIKRLNRVLETGPFFKEEDERNIYNDRNSIDIKKMGFCVITEIMMRYYTDYEKTRGAVTKTWFFDNEKAIYNNLSKI